MVIQDLLKKRYAVKRYNPEEIVEEDKLKYILESTILSASALGLQPYNFFVVKDLNIKKALAKHSFHGIEVENASHLIIIAAMKKITDEYVDAYIEMLKEKRPELEENSVESLRELTKNIVHGISEHFIWAEKQAYFAMGTLTLAAAEVGVDMTPMEIIDRNSYDQILDLDDNLGTVLVAVLGKRTKDDPDQFLAKVRRPFREIVHYLS